MTFKNERSSNIDHGLVSFIKTVFAQSCFFPLSVGKHRSVTASELEIYFRKQIHRPPGKVVFARFVSSMISACLPQTGPRTRRSR